MGGVFLKVLSLFFVLLIACGCKNTTSSDASDDDEVTLNSVIVSATNAKTVYYVGNKFSTTGLVIKAKYSDSSTKTLSTSDVSFSINGSAVTNGSTTFSATGTYIVTVTYQSVTGSYTISVRSASSYTAPTYVDNYERISSWSNKSKWNLSNTHDPTVFKWTDGYWYMFGTDASYGNAHESAATGKHFQGKRSTDLVNWEYVPGVMDSIPDWLVTKLNENRAAQGLSSIAKADISAGYWAPCARVIQLTALQKCACTMT